MIDSKSTDNLTETDDEKAEISLIDDPQASEESETHLQTLSTIVIIFLPAYIKIKKDQMAI